MEGAGAGGWRELVVTRFWVVEMDGDGWGWRGMECVEEDVGKTWFCLVGYSGAGRSWYEPIGAAGSCVELVGTAR